MIMKREREKPEIVDIMRLGKLFYHTEVTLLWYTRQF